MRRRSADAVAARRSWSRCGADVSHGLGEGSRRGEDRGYVGDCRRRTSALMNVAGPWVAAQAVARPARQLFRRQPGSGNSSARRPPPRAASKGRSGGRSRPGGRPRRFARNPRGAPAAAWLRERAHRLSPPRTPVRAPARELRRPWRIYQGRDTQRVDAHTRSQAQAEAWYLQSPAHYEQSSCSIASSFVTREEAGSLRRRPRTSRDQAMARLSRSGTRST